MNKLAITIGCAFASVVCLATPTDDAIAKGMKFLLAQQKEDGHFSDANTPALTALPLWAMSALGGSEEGKVKSEDVKKSRESAAAFVLKSQNEDGGFYAKRPPRPPMGGRKGPPPGMGDRKGPPPGMGDRKGPPPGMGDRKGPPPKDPNGSGGPGGLSTYNTAVCLSALHVSGLAPAAPLLKARTFLAASQLDGDDTMAGGFGYGQANGRRRYADLSNTAYAMDAMRRTEGLEEFRTAGEKKADLNWDLALSFVENLQQKDGERKGGAAYNERTPQAGTETNRAGRVKLMAYGSMSYAAVMSMMHAKLSKGDPRVRNALGYCERYWTLDENPGMGSQGLFYYYDILSRALSVAAIDKVGDHAWKQELAAKLVSLQKPDGSWANENNRFWEGDPVLCTSFALICLSLCR